MIEVWAAVCGASITAAALGFSGFNRQNQQGRDSLVRLTTAVDNLTSRLDILHNDIKTDNTVDDQAVAFIEAALFPTKKGE